MWAKHKNNNGFTIVELLIVIVVIAILAAISIVAYNGIQSRARAAAATSALTQSVKKIATWQVDYPDQAPDCDTFKSLTNSTGTSCTGTGTTNGSIAYQYSPSTTVAGDYCITATTGTTSYKITNTSSPSLGGCAGHGQGGGAAVTNLVTNPSFATNTANWIGSSSTISRVTSPWSADGNGAVQITPTAQDSFALFTMPTQAGKTYTIFATLRLETSQTGTFQGSAQQRNILPTFFDSAGGYLGAGGNGSTPSPNTPGTYSHRTTVTAPANSTQLRVRLYNGATTGGGVVYWDQVMIADGNFSGGYADGSFTDWIWNGSANNATSTGPSY